MLLNLSDVFTSEEKVRIEDVPIEMNEFSSRMGTYPIIEKTPLHLVLTNIGIGKVKMNGSATIVQKMECDRCLSDVVVKIPLEFERVVYSPEASEEENQDDVDLDVMKGYQLDIEVLVYNEALMNQPIKVLCKPDCKGICKKCGKDLNKGDCGCDTFVPDPRMAVLQDIFIENKEV